MHQTVATSAKWLLGPVLSVALVVGIGVLDAPTAQAVTLSAEQVASVNPYWYETTVGRADTYQTEVDGSSRDAETLPAYVSPVV